jgi:hypothetical protein
MFVLYFPVTICGACFAILFKLSIVSPRCRRFPARLEFKGAAQNGLVRRQAAPVN